MIGRMNRQWCKILSLVFFLCNAANSGAAEPALEGVFEGQYQAVSMSGAHCSPAYLKPQPLFVIFGEGGVFAGRSLSPLPLVLVAPDTYEIKFSPTESRTARLVSPGPDKSAIEGRIVGNAIDATSPRCTRHEISLSLKRVSSERAEVLRRAVANASIVREATSEADLARREKDVERERRALLRAEAYAVGLNELPSVRLGVLYRLGSQYSAARDADKLLELSRHGVKQIEKDFGRESIEYVGWEIYHISSLTNANKDEEARTQLDEATNLVESLHGPKHIDNAKLLLQAAYLSYKDKIRALELAERALGLELAVYGENSPASASTRLSLAGFAMAANRLAPAREYMRQAIAVYEREYGENDARLFQPLMYAAVLDMKLRRHDATLAAAIRANKIAMLHFSAEHPSTFHAQEMTYFALLFRGDLVEARDAAKQTLQSVLKRTDARRREVLPTAYSELAEVQLRLGDWQSAVDNYRHALRTYREPPVDIPQRIVSKEVGLAKALIAGGQLTEAYSLLIEASSQSANWRNTILMADINTSWRKYYHALNRLDTAIYFGKLEIEDAETVRIQNRALSLDDRRGLTDSVRPTYTEVANLMIESGRISEAHTVLGQLKEEELSEFIQRDAKFAAPAGGAGLTALESVQRERLRGIHAQVAALGSELDLIRTRAKSGLTLAEDKRREELEGSLQVANQAFRAYLDGLLSEFAASGPARNQEIGEKNLRALKSLQGSLRELGAGTVAVHFLITEKRLHAIVTTSGAQLVRTTEITEKEVNRRVFAFREKLATPADDPRTSARALHDVMIKPIEQDLKQAGASTLLVSLDGSLRYAPLAALYDGERYLVEKYQFAILTDAGRSSLKDLPQSTWRVGGLGMTRETPEFIALPAVREELEGILRHDGRGVLDGEVHFDEAFNLAKFRSVLNKNYPVIHIASHFVFRPGTEEDSFLLMGDGSRLSLKAIKDTDMDFNGVDLLTLSACDTGSGGGTDANGREVEGFGALAQRQGAKSVIATLWSVADESTGQFMQQFYALRENRMLSKVEALRQAQLALINGDEAMKLKAYPHPFFWAPFILMGNTR